MVVLLMQQIDEYLVNSVEKRSVVSTRQSEAIISLAKRARGMSC